MALRSAGFLERTHYFHPIPGVDIDVQVVNYLPSYRFLSAVFKKPEKTVVRIDEALIGGMRDRHDIRTPVENFCKAFPAFSQLFLRPFELRDVRVVPQPTV